MKRIYSSYSLAAVHHARNVLQAAGVAAVVTNEYLSSAMGELPPAECQAQLWVLDDADAARAQALLFEEVIEEPEWTCACGERLAAQFTQCWRCGAFRAA